MEALITLDTFREANKSPFNTFYAFNYVFSSCPAELIENCKNFHAYFHRLLM